MAKDSHAKVYEITGRHLVLAYHPDTGLLDCRMPEDDLFLGGCMGYVDGEGNVVTAAAPAYQRAAPTKAVETPWGEVEAIEAVAEGAHLPSLTWTVYPMGDEPAVIFEAEITNTGANDLYIREIYALSLTAETGGRFCPTPLSIFFGAPYSKSGLIREPAVEIDEVQEKAAETLHPEDVGLRRLSGDWSRCWWTIAATDTSEGGHGLTAGVLECANVEVAVLAKEAPAREGIELIISGGCYIDPWNGDLYAGPDLDRRPLRIRPGCSFKMSAVTLIWDTDAFRGLDRYADALKTCNRINLPDRPISGFFFPYSMDSTDNTSLAQRPNEDNVTAWMDFLDKRGLAEYDMRYLYMDFGGVASENLFNPYLAPPGGKPSARGYRVEQHFPKGIKAFVDMVRSRGFRIGWATRPFTYVLAGAHDDETQIDEIYGHAREWGIDYVILDFHYDFKENLSWERTAMEVYRRCYQLVRRAIGKAVFLEACGAPYGTVLGLADALRMSRDWRPDREQTELPGFKALYFLNGKCFWNHPEYLDVSEVPFDIMYAHKVGLPRIRFSFERARAFLSLWGIMCLNMLAGGGFLPKPTNAERVELYKKVCPVYPGRPRPVDLFERDMAEVYDLVVEKPFGSWHVVGFFNWDEQKTETITLDLNHIDMGGKTVLVFDFWEEEFVGVMTDRLSLDVPPQDCKILSIHEANDLPTVISTNQHITQGGVELEGLRGWNAGEMTLEGTSVGPEDTSHLLFIWTPSGLQIRNASGCEMESFDPPITTIKVGFGVECRSTWKVRFGPVVNPQ